MRSQKPEATTHKPTRVKLDGIKSSIRSGIKAKWCHWFKQDRKSLAKRLWHTPLTWESKTVGSLGV